MLINRRSKAVWDGEDDEEKREFLRAWSFTSFFYSKYTAAASTGGGYPGVRRWTKKVSNFVSLLSSALGGEADEEASRPRSTFSQSTSSSSRSTKTERTGCALPSTCG